MNEATTAAKLRGRALALAWFILAWDVAEGVIAVAAGLAAGSIALIGFGIDSGIEVFAAAVVIWQLHGSGGRGRERLALQLIAVSFFALAAYVGYEASRDLLVGERPDASPVGIGLNIVALLVMVPVAIVQRRTGRAMGNEVVVAQSSETWLSNFLSLSLLIGLGLNAVWGLWWADPAAAMVVAALAARSGWDAWQEARERAGPAPKEDPEI
jgi:divalent metal cation (Fe/Co/Zn/Cd) transporter